MYGSTNNNWGWYVTLSFTIPAGNPVMLQVTDYQWPGEQPTLFDATGTNVSAKWSVATNCQLQMYCSVPRVAM